MPGLAAKPILDVRVAGSRAEQVAFLFRDYLREHSEERDLYARRKRERALRHRDERAAGNDAKAGVIRELMFRADRWSQAVGWAPGPSDACARALGRIFHWQDSNRARRLVPS